MLIPRWRLTSAPDPSWFYVDLDPPKTLNTYPERDSCFTVGEYSCVIIEIFLIVLLKLLGLNHVKADCILTT